MINTYILTIRLLRERAKFCSDSHPLQLKFSSPASKGSRIHSPARSFEETNKDTETAAGVTGASTIDNAVGDSSPLESPSHSQPISPANSSDRGVICAPFLPCPKGRRVRSKDRFRGGSSQGGKGSSSEWRRRMDNTTCSGHTRKMSSPGIASTSRDNNKRRSSDESKCHISLFHLFSLLHLTRKRAFLVQYYPSAM